MGSVRLRRNVDRPSSSSWRCPSRRRRPRSGATRILSDFELDFEPFADGGTAEDLNRHGLLAAAGILGERAGLRIQRNGTVISTQRSATLEDRGVWFGSIDEAIRDAR